VDAYVYGSRSVNDGSWIGLVLWRARKKRDRLEYPLPVFFGVRYGEYHLVIYGYPLVFGPDVPRVYRRSRNFFFHNVVESNTLVGSIPASVYAAFEMTFAAITVALISGAIIDG